jgi:hypothetical protein
MKSKNHYQKATSYSPPQRVEVSPAKSWSNKLRIGGSDDSGRCSSLKNGKAYENRETHVVVKGTVER